VPVGRSEWTERRVSNFERCPAGFTVGIESRRQQRHRAVAAAGTHAALRAAGIPRRRCWGVVMRGQEHREIGTDGRGFVAGFCCGLRRRMSGSRMMRVAGVRQRRRRSHEIGRHTDRNSDKSAPEHDRTSLSLKRRDRKFTKDVSRSMRAGDMVTALTRHSGRPLNISAVFLTGLALIALVTTVLPMIPLTAWWIRVWDFPRAQLAVLLAAAIAGFVSLRPYGNIVDWTFVAGLAAAVAWQLIWVGPYLRGGPREMKSCDPGEDVPNSIALLTTNVLQSNRTVEAMIETVVTADPDIFFAVEVDEWWTTRLADALRERYSHQLLYPLSNEYGLALFSRFELIEPEVRFVFDEAIPSIRTGVRLRSGATVSLYGVHPRPPSLQQDTTERDIELLRVAKEISERAGPAIVLGDLNDVAWSRTTLQFTRVGGLLDPRRGRGFYNTYPARWPGFRYPLDYIFATAHFRICRMKVLPGMGSDHLPLLAEFRLSN